MIRAESLTYEYPGKRALDDVSFVIPEGSITALVGPNGSGKTTLLRCIAALDEPLSGKVFIDGIDVSEHPRQAHRLLGYLSDSFGLYGELTIRQCLMFSGRLHQIPEEQLPAAIQRVMDLLELHEYLEQKAAVLSRGWRQRLGIAQAIIHGPKLLLLDEPASGLDPESRASLSVLLRQLQHGGMTMMVSSHILAELEDYCTDMLVLREGRIIEHRPTTAIETVDAMAIHITFTSEAAAFLPLVNAHPGVSAATADGRTVRLQLTGGEEKRVALLKSLVDGGAPVSGFSPQQLRLQDIYLALPTKGKES